MRGSTCGGIMLLHRTSSLTPHILWRCSTSNRRSMAMARVRYLVADVDRSIAFYTNHLGFKLEQQSGSAFARVVKGDLTLLLCGPQRSGHRPLPDARSSRSG